MKKSIFKRIGLIALALFIGVGSLFMSNPLKKENSFTAHADVTYPGETNFISSDIVVTRVGFVSKNTFDYYNNWSSQFANNSQSVGNQAFYNFSFRVALNTYESVNFYYIGYFDSELSHVGNSGTEWNIVSSIFPNSSTAWNNEWVQVVQPLYHGGNYVFDTSIAIKINRPVGMSDDEIAFPSLEMVSVEIGNSYDFNTLSNTNIVNGYIDECLIVSYVDSLGWRFSFAVPSWSDFEDAPNYYSYRKYFLTDVFDGTDNDYYNQGFADGKAEGLTIGENGGYQHGFDVGYDSGFIAGRADAFESEYDYTFLGLIGAVVDAPLNAFRSLFNFELLGVNLLGFFTGVLTFALIIFVIRLIAGGK